MLALRHALNQPQYDRPHDLHLRSSARVLLAQNHINTTRLPISTMPGQKWRKKLVANKSPLAPELVLARGAPSVARRTHQ